MEDLTIVELYILDTINHYSKLIDDEITSGRKMSDYRQRIIDEERCYVFAYRNILEFIRKLRKKRNNDNNTGKDNSTEA